mgnify:CR=1 FL=1
MIASIPVIAGDARTGIHTLAGDPGDDTAFDLRTDEMTPARLLSYWPVRVAPGSRRWISENVQGGQIRNVSGALRRGSDR